MPEVLTAENTRAPSTSMQKMTKGTVWVSLAGTLLAATALAPALVIPIAALIGGIVSAAGSEIRNIQHTYEAGQRRDPATTGAQQNPVVEFIMNLLGSVL